MRSRISEIREVVSGMSKEEVSEVIMQIEDKLYFKNLLMNFYYNFEDVNFMLCKTNALSYIASIVRLVAHEQGKLEDKLYA